MAENEFVTYTTETNALDYLEEAFTHIKRLDQKRSWKWVVIGLHGALYGFAICAIKGTDYERVLVKKGQRKELIPLGEALGRCEKPDWINTTVFSKPLVLTEKQKHAVKVLKDRFRNVVQHFVPKIWHFDLRGMPEVCNDVLTVITFLALETGNIHLSEEQRHNVEVIVSESKKLLTATGL